MTFSPILHQARSFRAAGVLSGQDVVLRQSHIGLYPPVSGNAGLQKACEPYAGEKGNLQFPLDKPIPYGLIAKIVKHRVKQDAVNWKGQRLKQP